MPVLRAHRQFGGARSAPLLPLLDPVEVVEEAWTAMLAGRPFVVLPKTVMLSEMLKGVVPTGVRDLIADHVIGVYHTMDDFTAGPKRLSDAVTPGGRPAAVASAADRELP